ncbi:unnamed protein product [Zymoseptoria tritici ST99CH_1E4]|uniref:Uncharacterized protein n=1 Tax=Zymoseptoria tritici ST99CH_1E4 TaxID=1276532 RepID=A0A2H1H945_ZYMTR|nr:unnamed protein product [Zymoseptoria tritici ST99CH_1E4]
MKCFCCSRMFFAYNSSARGILQGSVAHLDTLKRLASGTPTTPESPAFYTQIQEVMLFYDCCSACTSWTGTFDKRNR